MKSKRTPWETFLEWKMLFILKSSTVWIPRERSAMRMKVLEFPADKAEPRIKEVDLLL